MPVGAIFRTSFSPVQPGAVQCCGGARRRLVPRLVIPKERTTRLRRTISGIFDRATLNETLESRLKLVNPVLRGWRNFYRHAWGAKRAFTAVNHHVWCTILRWLRKKHPRTVVRDLKRQYGWYRPRQRMLRWRDNGVVPMPLSSIRVVRYQQGADPGPSYA